MREKHLRGGGGGTGAFFKGIVMLAVVAMIVGMVAFVGGRFWEFLTVWKPDDGTYTVNSPISGLDAVVRDIVVDDNAMKVYFEIVGLKKAGEPASVACFSEADQASWGQSMEIRTEHLWDVHDPDTFRPVDWECRGKDGASLAFAAEEPMLFWAQFPLEKEFDLKMQVFLHSRDRSYWSTGFTLDDLPKK
jgi:hypothetical protein